MDASNASFGHQKEGSEMKAQDIIRIFLSIVLITFVWLDKKWAINISLTLCLIGMEAQTYLNRMIRKAK